MTDTEETYRIRPLKWRDGCDACHEGVRTEVRETDFPIGWFYFVVRKWEDDQWYWGEVYRLGLEHKKYQTMFPCDSMEDGQKSAWNDWMNKIKPLLESVEQLNQGNQ